MGYRSEVGFCLQVKEPEKFVALLKIKGGEVLKEMMQFMYLEEGLIHFYHNNWKWYDDSEATLADIFEMAEEYDKEFAGKFARSGEECDDVVEKAFGEDGWELEHPYIVTTLELGFNPNTATKLNEENQNA
jgi:hypothetical protein